MVAWHLLATTNYLNNSNEVTSEGKLHGICTQSSFESASWLQHASLHTLYPTKYAHGFVVLCFVVVTQSFIIYSHEVFIHIHQGCFAGTGAIVRLPQCQWSKPDGYGKISQCITTTKHRKAKTVCIFLGIYCMCQDVNSGRVGDSMFCNLNANDILNWILYHVDTFLYLLSIFLSTFMLPTPEQNGWYAFSSNTVFVFWLKCHRNIF